MIFLLTEALTLRGKRFFILLNSYQFPAFCRIRTAFATAAVLFFIASSAWAATINVTADALDVLDGTNSSCSLREAIFNINNGANTYEDCVPPNEYGTDDTINIPAGTYITAISAAPDDDNAAGDYDILRNVTIAGAGADNTIIDGNSLDRIFHIPGSNAVTISGVTLRNGNSAVYSNNGGAILNVGTLTVADSTVSGNTTTHGGGIRNTGNTGTLIVTGTTIKDNTASRSGGGISNANATTVTNSTISGNTAGWYGGGIVILGTAAITNSTIIGNSATLATGGIHNDSSPANVTVSNTIVANQVSGTDCNGNVTSSGYNLESSTSCGFTQTGDVQNSDPLLGSLTNNGGPTQTHALFSGSPAIDSGDCAGGAVGIDQRGVARPQGDGCDIGAFEYRFSSIFYEDFEIYPENSYPTSFTQIYNGSGTANQKVITTTGHDTADTKVFRLEGVSSWASEHIKTLPASLPPTLVIDAYIQPVNGSFPGRFGLRSPSGTWGTRISAILFDSNGKITAVQNGVDSSKIELGTYAMGTWYRVTLEHTLPARTYNVYIDGVQIGTDIPMHPTLDPTQLHLTAGNLGTNQIYFDNVGMYDQPPSYIITATATGNGSISPSGAVPVSNGSNQTFAFTPDLDHHVEDVLVDEVSAGALTDYTFFNVTAAHTINATFAIDTYQVSATVTGGNGNLDASTPTPVIVNHGATASFQFNAVAGYHVASISGCDLSYTNTDNTVDTYTATTGAVTAGCNVDATFAIDTYQVTATVTGGNGSLDPSTPDSVMVNHGAAASFQFNAVAGYHVASISGCGLSYTNTDNTVDTYTATTGAVTAGCNVDAAFVIDTYQVTATVTGGNGSLDRTTPTPVIVNHGATMSFQFSADEGYHVASISGCGLSYTNTDNTVDTYTATTGAVTAGCNVDAVFAIDTYTLTVETVGSGQGTVNSDIGGIDCPGNCNELYGSNQTIVLTATPDNRSKFKGWGGDCTGIELTCSITMDQAKNVTAQFHHFPWVMFLPAIINSLPE
ncbi:MAG: right-handed parallel beta-helix repeat-containing protein [Desulfocapsa sp.]|nr:right-handed parallel beta-helix repeat-containing protein [Desulfocapsa sp.]